MTKSLKMCILFSFIFLVNNATAQSIDNAKKLFNYERYVSAKTELQKLLAADPKNADANYWLVLSNLMMYDMKAAKASIAAALAANPNNALITVAAGHVALFDNNKAEARSKFETAISLSDKKTLNQTLIAIGRANGTASIAQSEPDYGIEKLNIALVKEPNNVDILITLGDCYRRKIDGSNAVQNYTKAANMAPQNPIPVYRMGQVYKTQDNCNSLIKYFTEATTRNAEFMPAYRELFDSYANDESQCYNIANARTFLDKFIATSDPGFDADKIKMTFCYYNKDYACALTEANAISTKYDEKAATDMLLWKGYIYDKTRDSVNALASLESYFIKQPDFDYRIYRKAAEIATKVPGKEITAINFYNKYLEKAEDIKAKVFVYTKCAEINERIKNYPEAINWYKKVIEFKDAPTNADYYKLGVAQYNQQDYVGGIATFRTYSEKFATDYRGNFWAARCNAQLDSTGKLGLAIDDYEKCIKIAELEPEKNKKPLVEATKYLIATYVNAKNDKVNAKLNLEKLKLIDPTNGEIVNFEAMLSGAKLPPPPKAVTTPVIKTPGVKQPAIKASAGTTIKPGTVPKKVPTPKR